MKPSFSKIGKPRAALIALAAVATTTIVLLPFREFVNSTEVALTLLLVVLFSSTLFGSRAGLTASISGIVSFNFFFLPPYYTLTIADPENWVTFGAFIITAVIAGQLSGYARRRADESEARQKKIESLYEELKGAFEQASEAEALRRSEKLKSALLDAVTHDLRTPLTSIKASVTTLLSDEPEASLDKDTQREFLEIINEETDRLNNFIEGMVGIAKVEAGAVDTQKLLSSVDEIIANAVERANLQLSDHQLEIDTPADLPPLTVDPASISQTIYTLLDNAAKYSPRGSRIRLAVRPTSAGKLRIVIEDQGQGIPKIDRDKVFDKFTRLGDQDIQSPESGLGLGLTIARGIIESQGGRIWIEDGSRDFVTRVVCELPMESPNLERAAHSA
jgi:two-component system sensor histidine kinase KdpD